MGVAKSNDSSNDGDNEDEDDGDNDNAGGKKPSSSSSQPSSHHPGDVSPKLGFESRSSPYQSSLEVEEGDDEQEGEDDDDDDVDEGEDDEVNDEQEEDGGDDSTFIAAAAALSPASPAVPLLSPSSSSSRAAATATASHSSNQAAPLPMITEDERQELRDAIFDILVHRIYSSLSITEKSTRIDDLYDLAKTMENDFYEDRRNNEYLRLFAHARLLEKLESPSIRDRYSL